MNALRSMSVQSKMLVAFVLLTLVAIGVVAWIGHVDARDSLRAQTEQQLAGMQRRKADLVRTMLTEKRKHVRFLSTTSAMTEGARNLIAAFRAIGAKDVTPEVKDAVRRFCDEEFVPALVSQTGISPVKGCFAASWARAARHFAFVSSGLEAPLEKLGDPPGAQLATPCVQVGFHVSEERPVQRSRSTPGRCRPECLPRPRPG
jgi:hypothetical protein